MNACEDSGFLSSISFIKDVIDVISIIVPILLIIFVAVDLIKIVTSGDPGDKKRYSKILGRVIGAVLVFFAPLFVDLLLDQLGETGFRDSECWNNANEDNIAYYKDIEEANRIRDEDEKAAAKKQAEVERKAREELRDEERKRKEKEAEEKRKENESGNNNSGSSVNGKFPATKYNLTDQELIELARVCTREQGSVNGAAAEASLMANLFEKRGGSYQGVSGGTGLRNYVRSGGWFANSASTMASGSYTPEILAAVKDVLVNGNRTVPTYVDEHDCWNCNGGKYCSNGLKGDICTLTTNGSTTSDVSNRSNYKQDQTVVKNVYGSTYTFYCFPESNSDPFGYTSK